MSEPRSLHENPRRTPMQSRTYLNFQPLVHSPHPLSGTRSPHMIQETNSLVSEDGGVIFGTNISTSRVSADLERFIRDFETDGDSGEAEKYYYQKLSDYGLDIGEDVFEVKGVHLKQFSREIYYQFIYFPAEMISCFDMVLKKLYEEFFIANEIDENIIKQRMDKKDRLMMGLISLESQQVSIMRNLTPKDINRLVCIRGIVIRCSEIYPEMKTALFRCTNCKTETTVILENAKVQEPVDCANCRLKHTLEIVHNLCTFTDKQFVKFQELPDNVPEGDTPSSVTIICYDNNVDGMRPGDRVEVIGIYRTQGQKVKRNQNSLKAVFNIYLDLISYNIIAEDRFKAMVGDKATSFNDDEKTKFYEIANKETVIDDLVNSFAPSIYGNEDVKKGILAQLFGGARKDFSQSGRGRFRSDINICLVGDPSTAKSQLLQQVYKIAPRGIYTSGRGSSAVGLTANVRRDPETHEFVLESGALVLSDLGICCIDQFDKMDDNSKTILLEAMEQQTISVAKAGIVCQLNSRTAILAAANPINSKYNVKKSVVENINLNPALLSRFDLIYIILDRPQQAEDRRLASHILDIYAKKTKPAGSYSQRSTRQEPGQNINKYPRDILAKYITYARENVTPRLSEAAGKKLSATYLEMRKVGNSKKIITATPRQLESLIRISEAFAKMRLSIEVNENDVDNAVRLVKTAMKQAATDPETGLIDMDAILIGKTAKTRERVNRIKNMLMEIFKANPAAYKKSANIDSVMPEIERIWGREDDPVTDKELTEALKVLDSENVITLFGGNQLKPSFRIASTE